MIRSSGLMTASFIPPFSTIRCVPVPTPSTVRGLTIVFGPTSVIIQAKSGSIWNLRSGVLQQAHHDLKGHDSPPEMGRRAKRAGLRQAAHLNAGQTGHRL